MVCWPMALVTNQPLQLSYFVPDIASALLTYDRLRWHRSRTGPGGEFEEVTHAFATSPIISAGKAGPYSINGRTLDLRINGNVDVSVTFTDSDPVTAAQAAVEITNSSVMLSALDNGGVLEIHNVQSGTNASIEIVGGDAVPFLDMDAGAGVVGKDQDTVLVAGTHEYFFTDQNSDRDYWYRVEFLHSITADSTGTGIPFPANMTDRVQKSQTIVCFIRISDMGGYAVESRRITFHNHFLPNKVGDGKEWGVFRHAKEITTDRNGYAEVRMLRGIVVDMSIDGTGFVRKIQIPSTGDIVDLLDPSLVTADEFGIHDVKYDWAIRTS